MNNLMRMRMFSDDGGNRRDRMPDRYGTEPWAEDRRYNRRGNYSMDYDGMEDSYDQQSEYDRPNRQIGFYQQQQNRRMGMPKGDMRRHQKVKAGGTFWMNGGGDEDEEGQPLDMETAREWVDHMENEDPEHPRGEKWSPEELKLIAQKNGIPADGEKFIEFYAVMNYMYSDFYPVYKEFKPGDERQFFAAMARCWMRDKDAVGNKTAKYYHTIAKKQ